MYNRYIPQSDGSYRKSTIAPPPVKEPPKREPPQQPRQQEVHTDEAPPVRPVPPRPKRQGDSVSVGSFLRQLLPKDFDAEDLLIVLLLLLLGGDCQEDQNTALLTLVLYLFL